MSDNFRQKIGEILGISAINHGVRCKCSYCVEARKKVDRICLEVSKLAEGMKTNVAKTDCMGHATYAQLKADKAYVQKEIGR